MSTDEVSKVNILFLPFFPKIYRYLKDIPFIDALVVCMLGLLSLVFPLTIIPAIMYIFKLRYDIRSVEELFPEYVRNYSDIRIYIIIIALVIFLIEELATGFRYTLTLLLGGGFLLPVALVLNFTLAVPYYLILKKIFKQGSFLRTLKCLLVLLVPVSILYWVTVIIIIGLTLFNYDYLIKPTWIIFGVVIFRMYVESLAVANDTSVIKSLFALIISVITVSITLLCVYFIISPDFYWYVLGQEPQITCINVDDGDPNNDLLIIEKCYECHKTVIMWIKETSTKPIGYLQYIGNNTYQVIWDGDSEGLKSDVNYLLRGAVDLKGEPINITSFSCQKGFSSIN